MDADWLASDVETLEPSELVVVKVVVGWIVAEPGSIVADAG